MTPSLFFTHRHNGSLRSLLNANADYVVDALCGQLRDLQAHPRAPLLLAALLRRAGGVAPHMLPLMAEPLQAALRVGVDMCECACVDVCVLRWLLTCCR